MCRQPAEVTSQIFLTIYSYAEKSDYLSYMGEQETYLTGSLFLGTLPQVWLSGDPQRWEKVKTCTWWVGGQ